MFNEEFLGTTSSKFTIVKLFLSVVFLIVGKSL